MFCIGLIELNSEESKQFVGLFFFLHMVWIKFSMARFGHFDSILPKYYLTLSIYGFCEDTIVLYCI